MGCLNRPYNNVCVMNINQYCIRKNRHAFVFFCLNILFVIISFSFAVDLFAKAHVCTTKRKNTQFETLWKLTKVHDARKKII